jgi:hypothetical protein
MDSYVVNVVTAKALQELFAVAGSQGTKSLPNVTVAGVNQHGFPGFGIFQLN